MRVIGRRMSVLVLNLYNSFSVYRFPSTETREALWIFHSLAQDTGVKIF